MNSNKFISIGASLIKKNQIIAIRRKNRFIYGDVCEIHVSKLSSIRFKQTASTPFYGEYPEICYLNKMELYNKSPYIYLIDFNGNSESNKDLSKFIETVEKECPKCKSINDLD